MTNELYSNNIMTLFANILYRCLDLRQTKQKTELKDRKKRKKMKDRNKVTHTYYRCHLVNEVCLEWIRITI